MAVVEHRDEIIIGAMTELSQSSGRKVILEELKKLHAARYAKLLEVRENQDKPVYTEDQLLKRELHYIEYLWDLPLTLVKTSGYITQDFSNKI